MHKIIELAVTLSFIFSFTARASTKRINDVQLLNEYKNKKKSTLPICNKGPFSYIRFHPAKDDSDEVTGTIIKISDSSKEVSKLSEEDKLLPPFLSWVGDINGDGLFDLLLNTGGCGSDATCVYQLYANCGQGRYVKLMNEDQYALDMRVSEKSTVIAGTSWKNIDATSRYRDIQLGCDERIGDFTFPVKITFDGKKYVTSKAERKRNAKHIEDEISSIKKACSKTK
jgi:hypothetical protein